jgi:hypothetical protein
LSEAFDTGNTLVRKGLRKVGGSGTAQIESSESMVGGKVKIVFHGLWRGSEPYVQYPHLVAGLYGIATVINTPLGSGKPPLDSSNRLPEYTNGIKVVGS